MKISYRTHPALKFLDEGLLEMQVFQEDAEHFELRCKDYENVSTCFEENKAAFKKNIQFITKPFYEAITLAFSKMLSSELVEQITSNTSGAFIYSNYVTCYNFREDNGLVVFVFWGNKLIFLIRGGDDVGKHITFFSETNYKIDYGENYSYEIVPHIVLSELVATINFIKYAEIQTKELPAGQKVKGIDCKYVNDTKLNISYLNSTWFTNLVKSDAFKVRGHFRLQPKKNEKGEWVKELIWINEFVKSGYTSPARRLSQNGT